MEINMRNALTKLNDILNTISEAYAPNTIRAYKADFEELFAQSGWIIEDCFGDYELNSFDEERSDRLIFICKKAP